MNLVISTTIGWNIGDQFILSGVKNLLKKSWGDFQCVHHDRNPFKLPRGGEESHNAIRCGWADALVIAGSPGWTIECAAIYRTALDHNVPIYMIGIGAGCHSALLGEQLLHDHDTTEALNKAKLVICRDEIARDEASKYCGGIELLPCPAAMISSYAFNSFTAAQFREDLMALGPYYTGDFSERGLMAHQIEDVEKSNGRAFYSENADDYFIQYVKAKSVTSFRLHASVICRVFGVPITNLWPDDDCRCVSTWSVIDSAFRYGIRKSFDRYVELLEKVKPNINH